MERAAAGGADGERPRFYLYTRLVFMIAAATPLVFGFAPDTFGRQRLLYAVGLALVELGGLLLFLSRARVEGRLPRVLPVLDLAGLTLMGLGAAPAVVDPIYPAFVVFGVLYALILPRRHAEVFGIAAGLAYLITMAPAPVNHYYLVLVYAERMVAIPLVTWVTAIGTDEHRARARRLRSLSAVVEGMHGSLDDDILPAEVAGKLADVLGIPEWELCVVDGVTGEVLFEQGVGDGREEAGTGGIPEFERTILVVDDDAYVAFWAPLAALEALSSEEYLTLHAVSRELLVSSANRRLYGHTKHMSVTDPLTGLYNRRHLTARLVEELVRCRRYGKEAALLMIDADDFKKVNDTYGHQVGDEVLVALAELLRGCVREADLVARYGGEEFCVLLPEADEAGAAFAAEKVRERVASACFPQDVQMTVSIGCALMPDHASDVEELLEAADRAAYEAKATGKDRVCLARRRDSQAS